MAGKTLRDTTIYGFMVQMMFFAMASRLLLPLEEFYILLFCLLMIQVIMYRLDNPREKLLSARDYALKDFPPQFILGGLTALAVTSPLIIFGTPHSEGAAALVQDVVTQGVFVAFVETIYLVVVVETMWVGSFPLGMYVWPFVFGFMHPIVRENWMAGQFPLESITSFLYAAAFGFLFFILYYGGALWPKRRRLFGNMTTWSCHLVVNLVITVMAFMILGFQMRPV
jgi:hypothetical protein